jgi:transcriptional regulator with XRE-family HTH domain
MLQIGRSIRMLREAKGKSASELARHAGISSAFLSLIESGGRDPSLAVARRLAEALDVPPEALFVLIGGMGLSTSDERAARIANAVRELAKTQDMLIEELDSGAESTDPSDHP